MKQYNNILTEGNIVKGMLLFALPILIGNVFQQLYNVVDTAIIGNVLGDQALAAIGATAALYMLVIGFANGITNGFSVVLAKAYGEKDLKKIEEVVALIYALTFCVALVLTLSSVWGLHGILVLLKTPEHIIGQTEAYLRVIFIFSSVIMFYNMFAGILRAIGNSKTPLYFLIVSAFLNVLLDYSFIKWLHFGMKGAAYATVIAQIISVTLCVLYVWKKCPLLKFHIRALKWNKAFIKELSLMGLSMGLMLVVVSIGSVALQSAVNSLGEQMIAAHIAARKIDDIFMLPLGTLSTVSATFVSQNLGAGNHARIRKGIIDGIIIALVWSGFSMLCIFAFGKPMVKVITGTSDAVIIANAMQYMRINVAFFFILSFLLILRSSLQGVGRKIVPVIGSVVELVLKFGAVGVITNQLGYFGVCILEPVIWVICAAIVIADFIVYQRKVVYEMVEYEA